MHDFKEQECRQCGQDRETIAHLLIVTLKLLRLEQIVRERKENTYFIRRIIWTPGCT